MTLQLLIGLLLSAGIGLSLGLIGGGGSIITVPVLVYVLGIDAHQAVSMSLAVVGATSMIGASLHYRNGTVDVKTGALFGGAGIVGAFFGSRLTYLLSPSALLFIFAVMMLVIAALMLAKKQGNRGEARPYERSFIKAVFAGLVVGILTGFLGVGGGFLIVPALIFFGGLSMKEAVGTSLLVIAINCVAGLFGHLRYGGFDMHMATLVTLLAALGTVIGTILSHKASPSSLRKWFAVLVIAVAIFLLAKNYNALLS